MEFRRAASVNDLNPGEKLGIVLAGEPVLLVNLENEYYAIGGKCTHRGCMLSDGTIDGMRIRCVCHGSTFELKSGAVYKGPAAKPEPSYLVRVEGDQIQVEI
ncbi:MAG: Rieske (2Fe-2S) protein [Candidatus Bathyarchaeia archaeon]|jgi:nitrite reductase/ring-hydroxylating ferredoxin subunit